MPAWKVYKVCLRGKSILRLLDGFSSLFTGASPAGKKPSERLNFKTGLIFY
ncbi:MAG: hypothetical protein ACYSUJ_13815 [Planctomycetota bacterium]